jgi:hypothetical protein
VGIEWVIASVGMHYQRAHGRLEAVAVLERYAGELGRQVVEMVAPEGGTFAVAVLDGCTRADRGPTFALERGIIARFTKRERKGFFG